MRRLGRGLAVSCVLAASSGTPAQAQWWTCPSGQGDFQLRTTSNSRVRCERDAGIDTVPSICPNRDTTAALADRCQTPNAPVGIWVPAVCPAAMPPYQLVPQPGADVCQRSLPAANVAPARQVN
jgi:hypothetical protein